MAGQICYDSSAIEPDSRYRTLFPGSETFRDVEVGALVLYAREQFSVAEQRLHDGRIQRARF